MKKIIQTALLVLISMTIVKAQKISPFLYGQNMWLTQGAEGRAGYIDKLWPKIHESGVKVIRIGGAGYDRNMPSLDTLTKWVLGIKAIGAEPVMQVSRYKSAEESAKLVQYFNSNEKTRIKFWAIGNEPYHMGKLDIDSISKYIKSHASAMKAVDPTIKIQVPDLAAYYNDVYEALLFNDKYSVAGRDDNGNWYVDGINFHNYPNAKDYNRADVLFFSVTKMRGMMMDLVEDLKYANEKYQRFGEDALTWALTEFNITYNNPDDLSAEGIAVPSFINGQFWVDVFCMAMEYNALMVTPWCIQESDRNSTYFGYISGPPEFTPHATYYHLKLMAENMKGEYVKMLSNNEYLKVFGAQEGELTTIILMNQHSLKAYDFDLSQINEETNNGVICISSSRKLNLKYKGKIGVNSTLVLKFNEKGEKYSEILYTIDMAKRNLAPKINK